MRQRVWHTLVGLVFSGVCGSPTFAEEEVKQLLDRLLAAPTIESTEGFTAKVLVPPGQLYDPLFLMPRGEGVWLNDDGPEQGDKGSRLLSLDERGKISVLAGIGKLAVVTGFDIAPKGFGEFEGQIFTLAQAKVKMEGALANHIIQRIDPKADYTASIFCSLPTAGEVNKGVAGAGADARFGPEGSPFAGKFFAVTALNNTIYQTTADGQCIPFVTFDNARFGSPAGLTFSSDGKTMLVTTTRGGALAPRKGKDGVVVSVSSDGTVEEKPVVEGLVMPTGIAIAPEGFGTYAGQVFVADLEMIQFPVPMTQPLAADGKLYRVTPEGTLELVASGFHNPMGIHFAGKKLWITDINGDFIGGRRELPDGFLVEITVQ